MAAAVGCGSRAGGCHCRPPIVRRGHVGGGDHRREPLSQIRIGRLLRAGCRCRRRRWNQPQSVERIRVELSLTAGRCGPCSLSLAAPVNSAGGSLYMPPEVPDAVADPVGSHHGVQRDPEEADPRFASAPGFLVRAENLSAQPETVEDVWPVHVGPVEDFGATAQLNRRRRSLTLICSIRMWARLATRPGWRWLTGGPPRPAPEHRRGPGQIRG